LELLPGNTQAGTLYWRGFSLDPERGLVMFSDPVFQYLADQQTIAEATIYLRTAINVRDPVTWAWDRYVRTLDFGTNYGTGAKVYLHDESFLAVLAQTDDWGNVFLTTNQDALNVETDIYLGQARLEFQTPLPQDLAYAGLWPISPDGAIQQVGWSVGPEGATTRASRNSEFSTAVPLYQTRRFFEQLRNKKVLKMAAQVNDLARTIAFRPPRPD
jgi:hypothetical protein